MLLAATAHYSTKKKGQDASASSKCVMWINKGGSLLDAQNFLHALVAD